MISDKIKLFAIVSIALLIGFNSCKKESYSFGELKAPSDLAIATTIEGVDAANPNGNGTGRVAIAVTGTDALNYNIDFGDGTTQLVPTGSVTHKYTNPGTSDYTISVKAIGTGGSISNITKKVKVFVAFEIPAAMLQQLTNGSSKIWITDQDAPGHFGVGPNSEFFPLWYSATPNSREACVYDDEIAFSKDAANRVSVNVDNKGASMSIGAATSFYGFSGGDGCYAINTGGTKLLGFMSSTSGSNASNSTQIEFVVPGNGIINFGTGGVKYEILSITATTLHLRNIGADGNSWYQKLKVKP